MLDSVEAGYTVDVSEEKLFFMLTLLELQITLKRDSFQTSDYT
jgi:hypothetical protein